MSKFTTFILVRQKVTQSSCYLVSSTLCQIFHLFVILLYLSLQGASSVNHLSMCTCVLSKVKRKYFTDTMKVRICRVPSSFLLPFCAKLSYRRFNKHQSGGNLILGHIVFSSFTVIFDVFIQS